MAPPPPDLTERQAFLTLNAVPGVGPIALNRLLEEFGGDVRAVLRFCRRRLAPNRAFDPIEEEQRLRRLGVDFLIPADPDYPALLRQIHDPPIGLYRRGRHEAGQCCIAIVGTRWASSYGREVARCLAGDLARLGFCIVSGLALGIDTAAHEGALAAGGRTAAVLGTGIDLVYPPENADLFPRIAGQGALLSEFPLGRPAERHTFPMRNRIVSGMSAAVVVVESAADGGAMITARLAGEQGRTVLAVPGRIDQSTSAGCHALIRDGAALLTGVDDVLSELSYLGSLPPGVKPPAPGRADKPAKRKPVHRAGSPEERAVLECFRGGAILAPDAISTLTGLAAGPLSAVLMKLELEGLAARQLDGRYEAIGE